MHITVRLASLLTIVLLAATPALLIAQTTQQGPVTMTDPATYSANVDLRAITISDNQTHLLIRIKTGTPLPPPAAPGTARVDIEVGGMWSINDAQGRPHFPARLLVDLDNNMSTGIHSYYVKNGTMELVPGIDMVCWFHYWGGQQIDAGLAYYYPNGSFAGSYGFTIFSNDIVSGEYLTIPLNITMLAEMYQASTGRSVNPQSIKIYIPSEWYHPRFIDMLPSPVTVAVNFSRISVDGNASDWNGTTTLVSMDYGDKVVAMPDSNLTAFYIATDNRSLYIRVDLEGPVLTDNYSPTDQLEVHWRWLGIRLAWNGSTYWLYFSPSYFMAFNETAGWVNLATHPSSSPDYNVSWNGTSTLEFAINLSSMGFQGFGAGTTVSIWYLELGEHVIDYVTPGIITYTIGLGGSTGNYVKSVENVVGTTTITAGNTNVTINTTSPTTVYVGSFASDPMGLGGTGLGYFESFANFQYFEVSDPAAVVWPVIITVKYDDATLRALGLNESLIKVFYYDKYSGEYVELSPQLYTVDTENNTVTITVTWDVYNRSDLTLVPTALPLVVGGKLVLPSNDVSDFLMLAATGMLIASAAITLAAVARRRASR